MTDLLTICQDISGENGMPQPASIVGNPNQQAVALLSLINKGGRELREYNWASLTKEKEFQLVKDQESYSLPDDFERFVNDTMWDREQSRWMELVGPQVWADFKSGLISFSIWKRWRIKAKNNDNRIYVDPIPTESQTGTQDRGGVPYPLGIAYEYISKNWVTDSAGTTYKERFTADTDVSLIPERILRLDLNWRYRRALQLPYQEDKAEFESALDTRRAQDRGTTTLRMDGHRPNPPKWPNIPETGFGS